MKTVLLIVATLLFFSATCFASSVEVKSPQVQPHEQVQTVSEEEVEDAAEPEMKLVSAGNEFCTLDASIFPKTAWRMKFYVSGDTRICLTTGTYFAISKSEGNDDVELMKFQIVTEEAEVALTKGIYDFMRDEVFENTEDAAKNEYNDSDENENESHDQSSEQHQYQHQLQLGEGGVIISYDDVPAK
jgi:hypothetical protein